MHLKLDTVQFNCNLMHLCGSRPRVNLQNLYTRACVHVNISTCEQHLRGICYSTISQFLTITVHHYTDI